MQVITGDIFKSQYWDAMGHCANLYHTMGAGIARTIKQKYPEAYRADCQTINGSKDKLGSASCAQLKDGSYIFNLYAQEGIGGPKRNLRYDYLHDSISKVLQWGQKKFPEKFVFAVPYGIGCGLAGGDWRIVEKILEVVDSKFDNCEIVVYKLQE